MRKRFLPLTVLAALLISLPVLAAEHSQDRADDTKARADARTIQEDEVKRTRLDNGLEVVVVPNRIAPVATTMLTYKVGSSEAPAGYPGMAHALEHMMFRGSKGLSAQQLASISASLGGDSNAFTTNDQTTYYFTVPREFADMALRIHATTMHDLLNRDEDWEQERGAIEQEVSKAMSTPLQVAIKRMRQALYQDTPYAHDALGTRQSFDKTSADMLSDFYDRWYAPNNAVLVVTGNVDADDIIDQAKNLFGDIPARKLPERQAVKPGKVDAKTIRMPTDSGYGFALMGSRAPGSRDARAMATVEVLAKVLNNPRGPLYSQMVATGKAMAARYTALPAALGSIGVSYVVFPKGADADGLVREMRSILGDIADEGISQDQIEAAKRQLITEDIADRDSISGLAQRWTQAIAVDHLDSPAEQLEAIQQVSADDVNDMLADMLEPERSVLAILKPEGSGAPQTGGGFGGSESFTPENVKHVDLPDWAAKPLARISTPRQLHKPVTTELENGLKVITVPSDSVDAVHVYGHIRNDPDMQTPEGKEGVSMVLADMLDYGTQKHDRKAYQAALDAIGAQASAGTRFSLTVLPRHFDEGMSLLAENQLQPALPRQAFQALQQRAAASQAGAISSPHFKAGLAMLGGILPEDDPELRYATPDSIRGLNHQDVLDYYKQVFRPDLTTIVVVGDVDPDQVARTTKQYFGDWQARGKKPEVDLPKVEDNKSSSHHVPDKSQKQTTVQLAESLGLTARSPDYHALKMANQILTGGAFASRLYRQLRTDRGLVYYVASALSTQRNRTRLIFQYGSDPEKAREADRLIRQALAEMARTPVSDEELHQAKAGLIRQIPLDEASAGDIGQGLLARVALGQPLDEPYQAARDYQKLDARQIQKAVDKWLRPEDLVRVTQGPKPD